MTKFLKVVVMVFLGAMAIGLLIAVASLLLYAIVFLLIALVAAVVLAPDDVKAMVSKLTSVLDQGLGRIETLWQDIKVTLDQWGAREMSKAQTRTPDQANQELKTNGDNTVVKQQEG